ncbi:protein unc-79 homolog isoform X2 [Zalophus californianus]|uniref:Protein unc-79 homolog isoform X2 n=1 Tax=Zalophus californianus TaxID=9704 RepID=A0A6P9FKY9_ZALCA|nr:protein unc-79 homolog isoform X2 [Zalophus californianus]
MAPWDLQRGMTRTGPFTAARSKVRSGMWTMLVTPVASKIRYLQEYHNRVLHNIYPVPSGTDIANTLKYFSQTLLSVLRDAPSERGLQSRDAHLSDYPSLDYQAST